MNLVKFIDNRFQELRLQEEQENLRKEYCLPRDAEVLALQWMLATYRVLFKWIMVPKVFAAFFWMKTGMGREPQPVILDKIKADQKKDFDQKAKKLGMHGKLSAISNESEQPLSN